MDLNQISVFIKVVQEESFSAAAKALGMPNSTVSAKVSALEADLGVTLIQRTTRRLNITPAGKAFFEKCLHGLEEIQGAKEELAALQSEPRGLLRITAPVELGQALLPAVVMEYQKKFPEVQVEMILTDRRVELLAENVDLAIRAGVLKDSTLIAKKLGEIFFAPFASPKYLKAQGRPEHPRDLRKHRCIQFTPIGFESWRLKSPQGSLDIPVNGNLIVNDLQVVRSMVVDGMGIALLPNYFCKQEMEQGKIERVLSSWKSELVPVHFVYPAQKFATPKLTQFVKLGAERLSARIK